MAKALAYTRDTLDPANLLRAGIVVACAIALIAAG